MKYLSLILIAATACSLTSGCSYLQRHFFPKKDSAARTERKKEQPPMYLGTVHQVYPGKNFALLRIIGPMPRPGVTLISHPQDGSTSHMGNLVVTADSAPNRGIVLADIRSGSVQPGDFVYQYRSIAPEVSAADNRVDQVVTEAQENAQLTTPQLYVNTTHPEPVGGVEQGAVNAPAAPAQPSSGSLPMAPAPTRTGEPEQAPSYLDDIPNDINQWD